jgi:hypothetical protein
MKLAGEMAEELRRDMEGRFQLGAPYHWIRTFVLNQDGSVKLETRLKLSDEARGAVLEHFSTRGIRFTLEEPN